MDTVWNDFEEVFQELSCRPPVGILDQLSDRELAGAIHCHEEIALALCVLHFSDIHVEKTDRVVLEPLSFRLIDLDVR